MLFHMTRVPEADRGRVFDRFHELVTLPKEARREDVIRRDAHAIDICWNALPVDRENCGAELGLRGTLLPLPRCRTEVRRRLKSASQESFYPVTILVFQC